ncbi:cytochrome P450 [Stachybotrys elegans]|uniref:Cytochrome P450 n=1 Tax=Stachybotrys elegans TaxID=80388 RepID=A0A8K0T1P3_9HYPO|nr:cytochrome P450 [Stachybotrys elegans]
MGLALHRGLFIHGEWHIFAPEIFLSHSALFSILVPSSLWLRGTGAGYVANLALVASLGYLVSLLSSILVYRVFFHRLARMGFKGPLYMSTSKLWHVWKSRTSLNHLFLDGLNKQYGDFVRTGPSEITIFDPNFFNAVDGPRTECTKSEWYDILWPESSLLTTRDRGLHDARRRDWKVGFSPQALSNHFQKMLKHLDGLCLALDSDIAAKKPTQMRDVFYWLGFDFMGDFVFSRSFDMLGTRKWDYMVIRLQRAMSLLGPVSPAPWLIQLAFRVAPRVYQIGDWFGMAAWTHQQVAHRLDNPPKDNDGPDLVHYLLEQNEGVRTQEAILRMRGDSLNAMVAGCEPVPIALMFLFAELVQKPEYIDGIYQEVRDADINDAKILAKLPCLNAAIKETLRLYPIIPTGGSRKTSKNGVMIGNVFIPPDTTIIGPRYTIQRREDCFVHANEFIPDRWTSRPELVRNAAAYSPWGVGHHSCIARVMATDMLRATTARIIKNYQFRLAPGNTGRQVQLDMTDQLTLSPGHLQLCFAPR